MTNEIKKVIIKIIISTIILIIAIAIPTAQTLKIILFLISYLIIGFDVIKEAIENIIHGEFFDENFLMFIATVGAFITGKYPEAVCVMLLYEIGECFQDYAIDKSRDSISKLMDIKPDYANIEKDGNLIKVNPEEIKNDDVIIVKPGEKIPLDGIVIEGTSQLDTSNITGESIPQNINIGSSVYSGTINKVNMIKIKVTSVYANSTVSKILELVENVSDKKTKTESFITKFAKYYTPSVVLCALLLAFVPPLFIKDANFLDYIHRACSFLVISCPCALVISIPLTFFAGLGGASRQGILIKGSNYIETLSNLKTVVFDKTGTLTKGSFEVTKICARNISNEKLLENVAYAENYFDHPIANSIKKAFNKEIDGKRISNSRDITGCGIESEVDNKIICAGNEKLMKLQNIEIIEPNEMGTIIYVSINKEYAGYIVISDSIKKEAKETINKLKHNNINSIILTGDNDNVAKQVANYVLIEEAYSELLPAQKVNKMEEFLNNKNKYGKIAFVGDGINDAPVLMRADIGIAMGGLGSDAAIEAADVVLMDDNISKVNTAINISKKTLKIARENIYFVLLIKFLVLVLSAFNISTMWEAIFADVGVSFIAILNSLRAFKK